MCQMLPKDCIKTGKWQAVEKENKKEMVLSPGVGIGWKAGAAALEERLDRKVQTPIS